MTIFVYLDMDSGRVARYDSRPPRVFRDGVREPPRRTHEGYSDARGPGWDWTGIVRQLYYNPPAELRRE